MTNQSTYNISRGVAQQAGLYERLAKKAGLFFAALLLELPKGDCYELLKATEK